MTDLMHDNNHALSCLGRDWLQQLCLVNIDKIRKKHLVCFVLFHTGGFSETDNVYPGRRSLRLVRKIILTRAVLTGVFISHELQFTNYAT